MKLTRLKSDRPRRKNDFYPTPYGLAKAALKRLSEDEGIFYRYEMLDAGCGEGIWMEAAKEVWKDKSLTTYGIDLEPKHPEGITGDFLLCDRSMFNFNHMNLIFGNPPYSLMEEFVYHALQSDLLFRGGYVFFLCRLEFLASKRCYDGLFADYPPKRVYVLSRRPSFFSTNGRHTVDAQDYAMYLWQKGFAGNTRLEWLYWDYE